MVFFPLNSNLLASGVTPSSDTPNVASLNSLPPELVYLIFEYLSKSAHGGTLPFVDRRFRIIYNSLPERTRWLNNVCNVAAMDGHLKLIQWARQNGCPWDITCRNAALNGHLEVLQWARQNGCPVGSDFLTSRAIHNK